MTTNLTSSKLRQFFVVGNSRSGTTLMARILGNHSLVFTFEELHFFEELWSTDQKFTIVSQSQALKIMARLLTIQRQGYLTQGNPTDFLEEAQSILETLPQDLNLTDIFLAFLEYESSQHNKSISCEQTPRNVLYIKEILEFYPEARIINMIRDPRDILLSQKNRWKRPFFSKTIPKKEGIRYWINYHPITISKLWNTNILASERYRHDPRVYHLRFEDLLFQPEESVQEICQFLEISYDSELLNVPRVGSSNLSDRPDQNTIDSARAGSWMKGGLTDTEIFICQKINRALMNRKGYDLVVAHPNPGFFLVVLISFPLKLCFALLFSFKRMKNIKETLKRRLMTNH
ncbi:sulfotransferase [Crocosphaera sp. UHCC 0190]|uniref:sulfotransferase family protein n=1 Tax=Crocosphaera sp. UHCC 0190 TaxID=3110246 RepID=UPI002B1F99BA|nr:sulfotransferase [Crocosphaera sp. UHCC 0190]MEA5510555.1 sulfotransferase [Crocosphaera sp. UHCC 0190]